MNEVVRRFMNIFEKIFKRSMGGVANFGDSTPPPESPLPVAKEGWTLPNGEITQARWKGSNATVWWPLKDQVLTSQVRQVSAESVLCIHGEALYEFFTPALKPFIQLEELMKASQREGVMLHVEVADYRIHCADLRSPPS
jgi:hypothetical protein